VELFIKKCFIVLLVQLVLVEFSRVSRVSKVRFGIRVSIRIRVSLVLVVVVVVCFTCDVMSAT